MSYTGDKDYRHGSEECLGILLANLGTPDAPTASAVRRYLAEFLWDARVIEVPRPIWWLVLHGVILRFRPRRSAEAYRKVWTEEGSPLLVHGRRLQERLQQSLQQTLPGRVKVELGMRYGSPSIESAMESLRQAGCRRLLVLPMYPQYSATTTASIFDAVWDVLKRWRWVPEVRTINNYYDDPAYIGALAASITEHRETSPHGEHLLFSFHGVPRRYILSGDPYFCHCQKTARLVAESLRLSADQWSVSFQSRVGREEWLRPYTDHQVMEFGDRGMKQLDVVCPGFASDCLETLEEIAMQNNEFFQEHGGERLRYIPALNAREDHAAALVGLVSRHVNGWPEAIGVEDPDAQEKTRQRALEMGAER
jgi:ferrochelatase